MLEQKVKLIVFLDDAARRVLYCNLSFSEEAVEFEKGIKHILVSHGRIGMIYVDNGSTFIALQTKRILSILGIWLLSASEIDLDDEEEEKDEFTTRRNIQLVWNKIVT